MEIKKIERQIKELDLNKKLDEERGIRSVRSITVQVNKTINYLVQNPRITYIEINGVEIPKKIK